MQCKTYMPVADLGGARDAGLVGGNPSWEILDPPLDIQHNLVSYGQVLDSMQ